MKTMLTRFGAVVVALSLGGCAPPPPPPPVEAPDTRAADEAAIRAASKEWAAAAQAKDAEKYSSFYAADATLMMEAVPDIKGIAPLREAISGMMKDPSFALTFETTAVDVARSGDLAYELATYSFTVSDPKTKKPVTQKGNGVTVWKKLGGSWKVQLDVPVSDPPA